MFTKRKNLLQNISWPGKGSRLITTLLFFFLAFPGYAANPDGDLRIEIISAYNLVVDSNVESPSTYGPKSFFIGAKICNDGTNDLTDVFIYVGNYIDGTNDTPGVYPIETTDEAALGYPYSGDFSLTHVADVTDATRYVGTIPAGECVTQYWLVTYPTVDANGDAVWGTSRSNDDDLQMSYDVWATANDGGSPLAADATKTVTCRNEISAQANKIWPNGDNKVPAAYLEAIQDTLGWDILASAGGYEILPAAGPLSLSGIWYDLGNVNQGFDNNGDYVPDYNAWMQPVGDPDLYDPDCFRLTRTYGLVIVKLKTGGEYLIPFEDQLYFENIPENTGAVGLVFYEFIALDGPCTSSLSPYQEVASGSDNEKFNGDFGLGAIPLAQSVAPSISLDKSNSPAQPVSLPATITYTLAYSNSSTTEAVGQPAYGLPLVIQDSIPSGTEYIAGSAASGNTLPAGVTSYTILYSTDNKATWTLTEPSTASDVTDIQWWLSDAVPASGSGNVTFQVTVPTSYNDPMLINTGYLSFGSNDPFDNDTAQVLLPGINSIAGTVYEDDGGTTGGEWNETQDGDESGISSVTVTLYYDADGDGSVGADDFVWGTTTTDGSGNYSFGDLPDGYYIVVVDESDTDITTAYVETTATSSAISLDPSNASGTAVDETGVDFGFGPAVKINKYLSTGNPTYEGDTVSFTLTVSNRSDVPLGTIPVVDTFDADRLEFLYAIPEETSTSTGGSNPYSNTGLINWSNIGSVSGNGASSNNSISAPLVAHWAFEEGSGTTVNDSSSSGYTGTTSGGPAWVSGKIGSFALDFDATNDYVTTGLTNPGLGTSFAISTWVNIDATGTYYILTNSDNDSPIDAGEYGFLIVSGAPYFSWGTGTTQAYNSGYTLTSNTWHHLVLNYDGTNLEFYVDGTLRNTSIQAINLTDLNQAIIIGRKINANYFDGTIDDLRLYQDKLSASEITTLYESAISCTPSQLSLWDFEEGSGTTTADGSGNGLTATLTNSPIWSTGQVGTGALTFDGTDDYVIRTSTNVSLANSFSIAFWASTNDLAGGNAAYICNSDPAATVEGEWFVAAQATTGLSFIYNPSDGNQTTIGSNYTIDDGLWHHIVVNYNGENITFYVDGASVYSQAASLNISATATLDIILGNNTTTPANNLDGSLDQVIIYDCALTNAEISRLIETATIENLAGQEVTVVFKAKNQTIATDTTTNYATVTGATFIDGRSANDDTDQATAIILNTGSISGYIWNDEDGLGWEGASGLDANDDSLNNVRVILHECQTLGGGGSCSAGARADTVYTDENGYYEFRGLREDYYYYVEVISSDIPGTVTGTAEPDDDGINSGNGGVCSGGNACNDQWNAWHQVGTDSWNGNTYDYTNISFGYSVPPALYGTVWEDIDGDGIRDEGEPGIAGVTVNLSGTSTATVATDAEGNYNFGNLSSSGSYTLTVSTGSLPSVGGSWTETAESDGSVNNSISHTFTGSEISGSHDFGFQPNGTADIGDLLYFDWNGDGSQDATDEGIPDISISLYRDVNGNGIKDDSDVFLETTSTDANGAYLFSNYPLGDYLVIVDENDTDFPNAVQTGDPDESGSCSICDGLATVSIDGTTDDLSSDFGYQPNGVAAIGDVLWYDANGDGSQSGVKEIGIDAIKIYLYADLNADGSYVLVDSVDTSSDGSYAFTSLPDGNYRLVADSTDVQMPVDASGNTYNSTTGSSMDLVISGGVVTSIDGNACVSCDSNLDFGFAPLGSIGDMIFWDANNNGTQDWDEEGIGSVTVYLCSGDVGTCNSGSATYTTTTSDGSDGNPVGWYQFSGLEPGTYTIGVETASGTLSGISQTADPSSDGIACDDPLLISYGYDACNNVYAIAVNYGTIFTGGDFGYQPAGVIGDYVWFDQNGDGVQDDGEVGHAGDTIWICNSPGPCTGATAIDTAVTDYDGLYTFTDIPDGTYALTLEVPPSMAVTAGSESVGSSTVAITLSGGVVTNIGGTNCSDCDLNADFGLELSGANSISGTVCLDDGSEDGLCTGLGGEAALNAITISLYNDDGDFLGTTTTDGSGNYSFGNLPNDTYIVALGTTLPPLDQADLTTTNADVPAGGTITETTASAYQTIVVSSAITDADFAFKLTADVDFGDIVGSYSGVSGLAEDGARHILPTSSTLYLGSTPPDAESDYSPSADASGDGADEDGVTFSNAADWTEGTVASGNGGSVQVSVNGTGWLVGWIDFNNDGDFADSAEMIISQAVTTGTQSYSFGIPPGTFNNMEVDLYGRFRLFTSEPPVAEFAYAGSTYDGEVEDYFFSAGQIFPVEWLSFTVEQQEGEALLNWETASETNSDQFIIERSIDKQIFQSIGSVKSVENSSEPTAYSFTDGTLMQAQSPIVNYRLRQIDLDGSFSYSKTVELQVVKNENIAIIIYPNPAEAQIFIRYKFPDQFTDNKQLKIYSALGNVIFSKKIDSTDMQGELNVKVDNWAEGYYYITLSTQERTKTFKVLVK